MPPPEDLVQQLLDTIQQRLESKVLAQLNGAGGNASGIGALIDAVCTQELAELNTRAAQAEAAGDQVQAEMYRLIGTDVLPQAAAALRERLNRQ
jgi:chromosome condensin MukBEF complex kleisin-like MukF subunit